MTFQVRDGSGAPVEPHTCIFPILKESVPGQAHLVGTGFFMTTLGHFVTAKHVIFDVFDQQTGRQKAPLHALHFVEGSSALRRHITAVSFHNISDIAVGKMDYHVIKKTGEPLLNRVPRFTTKPPRPSSRVVTFAYPESSPVFSRNSGGCFRPNFYSGRLLAHSEQPRDSKLVTWPHYTTTITVKGGASGGPVFDEKGRVFGINCVGGLRGLSYMARATELLPLSVPECPPVVAGDEGDYTVLELAKHGHVLFEPAIG